MLPVVLAIDDSPEALQALGRALGSEFDLRFATNAEDGLQIASESKPDLILLDVVMPDVDGFEALRRLQSQADLGDIRVIFLTALHKQEDEERCLAAGARDYVSKPFNPAILRARVATQIKLKRQAEELHRLARLDCLTGLVNRRTFHESADLVWRMCRRDREPLSLLMIDVDNFKAYNDTYGHQQGDTCLRAVARCLKQELQRAGDIAARLGGEEFVCLLPTTSLANAEFVANRIRAAVEALGLPHAASGTAPVVTVSLGVSSTVPSGDCDVDCLIERADRALYQAKARGRNQVACQESFTFSPGKMEISASSAA